MKVCIAGGGKVGMYLAQSLLAHHHKVTIIEPQEALCRSLADSLDVPVVCGDAISFDTLRTADVASCDAFVAVTGVQLLRTPLLWLAGASVLIVRCPGGLLVLPGVPSVQADALASILTEDAV